jgi:hypothetical protein
MVIDTSNWGKHIVGFLKSLVLVAMGAASGVQGYSVGVSVGTDRMQEYLEQTKELPQLAEEGLKEAQAKADKAAKTVGKAAVNVGKKIDAAAAKVSKKIQDGLKPLDKLGEKLGRSQPPIPEPKPSRSRGNWVGANPR